MTETTTTARDVDRLVAYLARAAAFYANARAKARPADGPALRILRDALETVAEVGDLDAAREKAARAAVDAGRDANPSLNLTAHYLGMAAEAARELRDA